MLLFDTGKKLEKAFTKEQFDALVEVLDRRDGSLATSQELKETESRLQNELKGTEAALKADVLAVKGDLRETELRLQGDIALTRKEIKEVESRLETKMKELELRLLKWQLGVGLALAVIMAKGFGWLGF